MPKKPDIIESEIFSQLLGGGRVLKVEPEELGPINLENEMDKKEKAKSVKPVEHNFKQGDLVVPNTGLSNAFFFQSNMKLNPSYSYHLANSAERTYYYKRVKDYKTHVSSYAQIQDIAQEKHNYDIDKEKSPGNRILI